MDSIVHVGSTPTSSTNTNKDYNMETPYKNCIIYGLYTSKKDGRKRIVAKYENGIKKTISYPKYLMELHINKYLDEDDTVDHIDGNIKNNDISNLRILKRKEHCKQDVLRIKDIVVKCSYCRKEFTIKGNKIRYRNRHVSSKNLLFCSKECTGKYGAMIRYGNNRNKLQKSILPKIEKHKLKDI